MSAILSADDLNDFISPGVACVKPIETIPEKEDDGNAYEVTTEDKLTAKAPPAQISLTDCLACSGCVTSAEAVLVSLQSHSEVLNTLDAYPSLRPPWTQDVVSNGINSRPNEASDRGKIFIASVSPQTRASLAATYNVSSAQAGNMIAQLLSGPNGLAAGGAHKSSFLWVLDTNNLRDMALLLAAEEASSSLSASPKKPVLTSACPGWICYAEKTHPHVLPHLSRLKSPQALAGTLLKSVLARRFGVAAGKIWHLAVMPCFDKKLEASRSELSAAGWSDDGGHARARDTDCVITARELVALAAARGLDFAALPRHPLPRSPPRLPFPDPLLDAFLFPPPRRSANAEPAAGTGGGYLWHVLQRQRARHPGSRVEVERGRNADVVEYVLVRRTEDGSDEVLFKAARYYGFRNIQNLVRKLRPPRTSKLLANAKGGARRPGGAPVKEKEGVEYAYVEVMACPGGCTNGGGQMRVGEVMAMREGVQDGEVKVGPQEQREWLGAVDEAYFSASSHSDSEVEDEMDTDVEVHGEVMDVDDEPDVVDGVSRKYIHGVLERWRELTGVETDKLVCTSYRAVESDVGKEKKSDVERVAGLASSIGGGW